MADEQPTIADRLRALTAANTPAPATGPRPAIVQPPAPGFRFGKGDKVIDLVGGDRGVVAEFYQSATNSGPVYEVRIGLGRAIVRLERELERDGAQHLPPTLPRI
jgi:hypothetical protein